MENGHKEYFAATVIDNGLQTSQNGTDSVAIQFCVTRNLATNEEVAQTFIGNLYLSARAIENTIKTLKEAFGYTPKTWKELNDPATLKDKECEITVVYEEYNNELRPKVQWINAPGSFASRKIKRVDGGTAAVFATRYDGYLNQGTPRQQPRQQKPTSYAPVSDDDLPF